MTDPVNFQGALEAALFARLSSVITGASVYQHVPDNKAPPVIIIADIDSSDSSTKDRPGKRYTVRIVTVIGGPSRAPLNALQAQVDGALSGWTPAATATVAFGDMMPGETSGRLLPDDGPPLYYGEQDFACEVWRTA